MTPDGLRIRFTLAHRPTSPLTLRVGISAASFNGRPMPSIGGWQAAVPAPALQPRSRTLTVGTYRGNNTSYSFGIPASAFRVGVNDLVLNVASGEDGHGFLSPGISFDAIALIASR